MAAMHLLAIARNADGNAMTNYQADPEGGEYLYPRSGDPAPRVGAKVQLLTIGGVHTNGPWRDDGSCIGWLPLPKRNMGKEDMISYLNPPRL